MGEHAVGPDAERAAGAFVRGLQPVLRELRPTLKSYTARTQPPASSTRLPVRRHRAAAGPRRAAGSATSAAPGAAAARCRRGLERRPRRGAALGGAGVRAGAARPGDGRQGPALQPAPRRVRLQGRLRLRQRQGGPAGAPSAPCCCVLLIASGIVRNTVLERREKQVDAQLCDVTQRVLGTLREELRPRAQHAHGQREPGGGDAQASRR